MWEREGKKGSDKDGQYEREHGLGGRKESTDRRRYVTGPKVRTEEQMDEIGMRVQKIRTAG